MSQESLCRLCFSTSSQFQCLYDDSGQLNGVYEIAVKYFDPMILTPVNGDKTIVICIECWQLIRDFYSFQQTVIRNQSQLKTSELAVRIEKLPIPIVQNTPIKEEISITENSISYFDIVKMQNTGTPEATLDTDYDMTMIKDPAIVLQISSNIETVTSLNKVCERRPPEATDFNAATDIEIDKLEATRNFQIFEDDQNDDTTIGIDNYDGFIPQYRSYDKSNHNLLKSNHDDSILNISEKQLEYDEFIAKWKPELECPLCKLKFTKYVMLHLHFKKEHPMQKCYTICCKRKLISRFNIVEHIRLHLNPNIFKCHICGLSVASKASLKRHMLFAHKNQFTRAEIEHMLQERFINDIQGEPAQVLQAKRNKKLKFKCNRCNAAFCSSSNRSRHKRLKHTNYQSMTEEESSNSRLDQLSTTSNQSYPIVIDKTNSMLEQTFMESESKGFASKNLKPKHEIIPETLVNEENTIDNSNIACYNEIRTPALEIIDIKEEVIS